MVDVENFYYRLKGFGRTLPLKDDARRPTFIYPFGEEASRATDVSFGILDRIGDHIEFHVIGRGR